MYTISQVEFSELADKALKDASMWGSKPTWESFIFFFVNKAVKSGFFKFHDIVLSELDNNEMWQLIYCFIVWFDETKHGSMSDEFPLPDELAKLMLKVKVVG